MDDNVSSPEIGDTAVEDIPSEAEIMSGIADVHFSPSDHQRIKDLVNGEEMQHIKNHDRRYLIVGVGAKPEPQHAGWMCTTFSTTAMVQFRCV